ncbi:hypothetical protein VUJ49_06130 [Pseudomonas berkeleyensis]|uniref:Uncharacterized protein n=1 Tax=Pseudomonas berkeleyensis TaxID=2726956 RepID=A0A7G5DSA9_9PSED|nr:hypothetical protein [Pseudomonas berkeleyensis]QMV64634.1 hypothetical protein HS968_06115 [Pseudomonas berkeleyensis]WSO40102.1 hypothetical protein VUJ49_06130 [Pseudomonas berkeleyensis]
MTRFLPALIPPLPLIYSSEICKWTDEISCVHFCGKPKDKDQAEQLSLNINLQIYKNEPFTHKGASTLEPNN